MKRRRTWLLLLLILAVPAAVFWFVPSTYDRIQPGMAQSEVRDLLGPPTACVVVLKAHQPAGTTQFVEHSVVKVFANSGIGDAGDIPEDMWVQGMARISVQYEAGRVVGKSRKITWTLMKSSLRNRLGL
jgi:hypothetical protein